MLRPYVAAAALLVTAGCAGVPTEPSGSVMAGPAIQAADAACEPKFADRTLTSLAALAECQRDVALPLQQRDAPGLADMYRGLWRDKIALYARVDRGELTRAAADRAIAIEADNWLTNIRSARRV